MASKENLLVRWKDKLTNHPIIALIAILMIVASSITSIIGIYYDFAKVFEKDRANIIVERIYLSKSSEDSDRWWTLVSGPIKDSSLTEWLSGEFVEVSNYNLSEKSDDQLIKFLQSDILLYEVKWTPILGRYHEVALRQFLQDKEYFDESFSDQPDLHRQAILNLTQAVLDYMNKHNLIDGSHSHRASDPGILSNLLNSRYFPSDEEYSRSQTSPRPAVSVTLRNTGESDATFYYLEFKNIATTGGEAGAGGIPLKPANVHRLVHLSWKENTKMTFTDPIVLSPGDVMRLDFEMVVDKAAPGDGPGELYFEVILSGFDGVHNASIPIGIFGQADDI